MSFSHEQNTLKRDHDFLDFDSLVDLEKPFTIPTNYSQACSQSQDPAVQGAASSMPTPPVSVETNKMVHTPGSSRSASLTDAGSVTPPRGESPVPFALGSSAQQRASPSPSAFTALSGSAPPPAKKPRLSFAEKEAKRIAKEIKDREMAVEKARKQRERQAHADDKVRRDAEKEAERQKREAERDQKRAAAEAERAAKEEKKRRKEEEKAEKLRLEEEKSKKAGKQKSLNVFFQPTAITKSSLEKRRSESPAPNSNSLAAAASPASLPRKKPEKTAYEKIFGEFFVFDDVTVAPNNRFERDDQASESLHTTIDSYLLGHRSPGRRRDFDPIDLFHLSGHGTFLRGKRYMPVQDIMAEMSGKSTRPVDLTTDSQNTQIKRTNDLLRTIPMKFLKFQEDVRPPYRGTYTRRPENGIEKLARNPMRRDLPDTNYDYDSEAEWIEDEDAEDLKSEGDEDDDMGEDGEDMDGFLDDENDEAASSKRLVLQGDLEPISTGMCWEDHHKRSTKVKMMPYRMEIILDHSMKSIDPFSTQYWDPTPQASMDPPRLPLSNLKPNSVFVNSSSSSNKPVKPFFSAASDLHKANSTLLPSGLSTHPTPIPPSSTKMSHSSRAISAGTAASPKTKVLLAAEDMEEFRKAIEGSNLTKLGLVEVLKKQFTGRSSSAIKNTLALIAKRVGRKEADKVWVLVDQSSPS